MVADVGLAVKDFLASSQLMEYKSDGPDVSWCLYCLVFEGLGRLIVHLFVRKFQDPSHPKPLDFNSPVLPEIDILGRNRAMDDLSPERERYTSHSLDTHIGQEGFRQFVF